MMSKKLDVNAGERFKGRQLKGRTRGETRAALAPETFAMVEVKTNGSLGQVDRAGWSASRIPVSFSVKGGSRYPGMVLNATSGQKVIFVETKQLVPVGTEVTIRLTPVHGALEDWGVVEGTVVWQCLVKDMFKNGRGFGLCLRESWPQLSGPSEAEGPRGTA